MHCRDWYAWQRGRRQPACLIRTWSRGEARLKRSLGGKTVSEKGRGCAEPGAERETTVDHGAFLGLGGCPNSVRCCGDLEGIGGSGGGFGRFGRSEGVQAVASSAVDRRRPWASLSMLWARQTRPHSWATLSSPRIRN